MHINKLFIIFFILNSTLFTRIIGQDFIVSSLPKISQNRYISISFQNDLFYKTDYYFTNGFNINLITPELQALPISKFLTKPFKNNLNYYGIELVQNIYTPIQVEIQDIIQTDRPYASELYINTYLQSYNPDKKTKISSELLLGLTGRYSLGEYVQSSFHRAIGNSVPSGWKNQLKTDIIVNYNYELEQSILSLKNLEINYSGKIRVGTLYDDLTLSFYMRTGLFNSYFSGIGQLKKSGGEGANARLFQFYLYLKPEVKYVVYNMLLQGGVFTNNIYEMATPQMEPILFRLKTGVTIQYKIFQLNVESNYLSPEIKGGREHKWAKIGFRFNF